MASLYSCAQYDFMLNKTYGERYQDIDTLFYTNRLWQKDKDTVYQQLNTLGKKAKKAGDQELYWETKLARIQYDIYNHIIDSEEGIQRFKNLEQETGDNKRFLLGINFWISLYYYWADDFGAAFEHQIKYAHLLKKMSYEEYPPKKNYLNHLGTLYYSFEDYDMAKQYLQEAEALSVKHNGHHDIGINNTLGLVMRELQQYDSALYYFNIVLSVAKKYDKYWWPSIANGNIGIIYYLQGRYKEAVPYLLDDINYALSDTYTANITNSIIKLADIYRRLGKYDSSEYYANMARSHIVMGWSTYKHMVGLYTLLGQLAEHEGNKDAALQYADSVIMAKDSVYKRRSLLLMAQTQRASEEERHKLEVNHIVTEKELSIQKRNNLIAVLGLSTIIGLLFLNRQNIRRKRLKAEKELADNKLQTSQQRLNNFTQTLKEKNQLIENFSAEIERLQALPCSNELPDSKENLSKLQSAIILTDDQWNDFRELFEQVHGGFLLRLKEKLPDLTPAETRFMALSKLKLSNKEMANMLGIGLSGMRNYKYRLRKKLNISDDADFEQLVDNI